LAAHELDFSQQLNNDALSILSGPRQHRQHPAAHAAAAAASTGPRAADVLALLGEQLAVLSGGRDRRGGAVITFPVV